MIYDPPLTTAILKRRYKRFLADVQLAGGEEITVHCPNTGAMLGCADPGSRVWLHKSQNPKRKYAYTWELVEVVNGTIVGVNTARPNGLVKDAIERGCIATLPANSNIRAEVAFGTERSRVDLLVEPAGQRACYVEVKNVTAVVEDGVALFPDAVTDRGTRHLRELSRVAQAGDARAAMVYCVQRADVHEVRPAEQIDPVYAQALRDAISSGVEVYALRGQPTPDGCQLDTLIPVIADRV